MKKLKIAMLIDGWDPIIGGGQNHVRNLCQYLVKGFNCEIDLFVRSLSDGKSVWNKNESYYNNKWRIIRVGPTTTFFNPFGRALSLFFTVLRVLKEHKRKPYDLIHAHAYLSGLSGKVLSFILRIPIIYTVHGSNLLDQKKRGFAAFLEKVLLTKFIYDAEISVAHCFLRYRNVNKNIFVIPNGVDTSLFKPIAWDHRCDGRMIFIGRLAKEKGVENLLKALNIVKTKERSLYKILSLRIIGEGIEKKALEELTHSLGLKNKVRFLGKISGKKLIREYQKAQLFILPSLTEGQPLTILEAFATGLPVIATDVGDNRLFVHEGKEGWIVRPGSPEALAAAIKTAFGSSLGNISEHNRKLAERCYPWEEVARKTIEIYWKLVKSKQSKNKK
jgi:glycosyltransferase involved in cell wall biosynthesis